MITKPLAGFPGYGAFLNAFSSPIYLNPINAPGSVVVSLDETTAIFYGDSRPGESLIYFNEAGRSLNVTHDCWAELNFWLQVEDTTVSGKFIRFSTSQTPIKSFSATLVQGYAQTRWSGELFAGDIIAPVIETDVAPLTLIDGVFTGTFTPVLGSF